VRFHRFSAEKRRVTVFFPGACPWKNKSHRPPAGQAVPIPENRIFSWKKAAAPSWSGGCFD
jgi:hypothetical protein